MALQMELKENNAFNSYGIKFEAAYFKIDNVRVDIDRDEVRIELRGYASAAARTLQVTREALRIEIKDKIRQLREGTLEEDVTMEELNQQLSEASKTVIGVYKEIFKLPFSNLDLSQVDPQVPLKDEVKRIVYNYLKTLDYFENSTDV